MRRRDAWWRLLCAVGALALATDAHATAPAFPGVITTTLASPDEDLPIPDNGSLVTVLPSNLGGVVIDADLTLDLTHNSADQLDMYLVAPSGRTVVLTTDNGQQNDDVYAGTTFDDQATGDPSALNVRNLTYTNLVPTGAIQPEGALSALVGEAASGPWALVILDDAGGTTGRLRSWSLTLTTLSSLPPAAPAAEFDGDGGSIPDNDTTGRTSEVEVAGLGARLLAVRATVSISHPNASQLDLFLTSPAGIRIDLATDIGNGLADLYQATTFDDAAETPIGDVQLPSSGEALGTVIPEGALGAFLGESPNGTWTLTVVDDTGGTTGTLDGWTLHLTAVAACGDGVTGGGEACDDGNATDGDGCDHDCSVSTCGNAIAAGDEQCDDGNVQDGDGCSSTCRLAETVCGDCADDDGNGLVDAADPGCSTGALSLERSNALPAKGVLKLKADVPLPDGATGVVSVVLADGTGTILCASLGEAVRKGRKLVARGAAGGGTLSVSFAGGVVMVKGKKLALDALDDPTVHVGVALGAQRFAGGGTFRPRGPKRIFP